VANGIRPEDVFTPRSASVNPRTYVSRPDLERALMLALRLPKHVVIHGESGSGKTWLYKKVLADIGYHLEVANMGLCAGSGTIAEVLRAGICREVTTSSGHVRTVDGGIPGIAKAGVSQTDTKQQFHDAFYEALAAVRGRARERNACLIFDNLEQVVQKKDLVRELAGYLLLLDDQRYADHEVKILLVGTSAEIRSLISQIKTSAPVANRISEIPEVARLSQDQAREFSENGLFGLLGCELAVASDEYKTKIVSRIAYFSDRIPLHIQEVCFYLACAAEENSWVVSDALLTEAVKEWLKSSLVADVSRVQSNLNSIVTKIGRRNQVIYCLGQLTKYDFTVADVEAALKRQFPDSSSGVALNVPQILSDLASSGHPIIRRNPNSTSYRFIDPKYRIVIRWLLFKPDESEEIRVRDFDSALGLWNAPAG